MTTAAGRGAGFDVCAWSWDVTPERVWRTWALLTEYPLCPVPSHPVETSVLVPGPNGPWAGAPYGFIEGYRFLVEILAERLSVDTDEMMVLSQDPEGDRDQDWVLNVTYAEQRTTPMLVERTGR